MARRGYIWLVILTTVVAACTPTPPSDFKSNTGGPDRAAKVNTLDLTKSFYKNVQEVDAIFGKPTNSNEIKVDESTKGWTPGEFRGYEVGPEQQHVLARFFRGKCVAVQMELSMGFDDAEEALESVGIDVSGVSPLAETSMITKWKAKVGAFLFKDVSAVRSSPDGEFDIVQFELVDPD